MTKYILLNALTLQDLFIPTHEEMIEAIEEFGCKALTSKDVAGNRTYFVTSTTPEALTRLCEAVELPGIVLEYTAVFDQFIEA